MLEPPYIAKAYKLQILSVQAEASIEQHTIFESAPAFSSTCSNSVDSQDHQSYTSRQEQSHPWTCEARWVHSLSSGGLAVHPAEVVLQCEGDFAAGTKLAPAPAFQCRPGRTVRVSGDQAYLAPTPSQGHATPHG
jgi:hypothetical protein